MGNSKKGVLVFVFFFFIISSFTAFGWSNGTVELSGFDVEVDLTEISPYSWDYIRVELSNNFSSATIAVNSDVTTEIKKVHKYSKALLPMICFKDGGLPLPDFSKHSLRDLVISDYNFSGGNVQYLQNVDQCYPLQRNVSFRMAYGEFVPGVYYAGLFNGLGNFRNQPHLMTNQGSTFSYSANVTIKGCADPTKHGQYCDQTVENLEDKNGISLNYNRTICLGNKEAKIYALKTLRPMQITVKANDIRINGTFGSKEISIKCLARANGIPEKSLYDYSRSLSKSSLVIPVPEGYSWYFSIQNDDPEEGLEVCLNLEWEVNYCPNGKDGPNCSWREYALEEIDQGNLTFPIKYFPDGENRSSISTSFPLLPLLSKSSNGQNSSFAWTFFYMWTKIAGENLHIELNSDQDLEYEMYVRFNGVPNSELWDYKYANYRIIGNKEDSLIKLYDSSKKRVNLFILYAREGWWTIGLRYNLDVKSHFSPHNTMAVSIETSPDNCSHHGIPFYSDEASGVTGYHYCNCDMDRGGFDCGVSLRPVFHSFLVIASNIVAILPAFTALHKKEYPESVIFMCSGIASAFYHACDEHRFCALRFGILQFMDFWLSFLAVISTFVYLTNVNESVKRTIHTVSVIVTVLLAATSPTRSSNIPIVVSLGVSGLLIGWWIELLNRIKSLSFSITSWSLIPQRLETLKNFPHDLMKEIQQRYRWKFVFLGLASSVMAITSRVLIQPQTYWIWHSLWHISIYMCPFFFLWSKRVETSRDNDYEIGNVSS